MTIARNSLAIALATALVACGGGGNNLPPPVSEAPAPAPSPTPTPVPTSELTCSVADTKEWVFRQLDEFYLFPDLLDRDVNPAAFATVDEYIDALTAPARAQSRDRFFTFLTSIEAETATIERGANAGLGVRLAYDTDANRVFVVEAFESAPAFQQGFDRGTELLSINGQSVESLMAAGGPAAVIEALGPSNEGLTLNFRIQQVTGGPVRDVSVTKTEYSLDPISDRYGVQVLNDNGRAVGYLNLRTFIVASAAPQLREAFATFRSVGVREVIVDLRYNGGGLVSVEELFAELMAADRVGQVLQRVTFRESLSENNETIRVGSQPQAIAATKIAFIGRGATASASESLANAFIPFLGENTALIGTNTFGKPVGQIALDRSQCDQRLRVVAFETENSAGQGAYYTGLASVFPRTCAAPDDITAQMGSPAEASTATALGFLNGASCTPINATSVNGRRALANAKSRVLLQPRRPSAAQWDIPGLY